MPSTFIAAGKLNTRLTIYKPVLGQSSIGSTTTTYEEVKSTWARVRPSSGAAPHWAMQQEGVVDIEITLRYQTGIVPGIRFSDGVRWYHVKRPPVDVENHHAILKVYCQELQAPGIPF